MGITYNYIVAHRGEFQSANLPPNTPQIANQSMIPCVAGTPQQHAALAKAQQVKRINGQFRRDLAAMTGPEARMFTADWLREYDPDTNTPVGSMTVALLLRATPGIGKIRANHMMRYARISGNKRLRDTTAEQRARLADRILLSDSVRAVTAARRQTTTD